MPERLEKILISACLLGERVRYDGKSKHVSNELLKCWHDEDRLVAVCPEVIGGLPVPRPAAEISNGDSRAVLDAGNSVNTIDHRDVTDFFLAGAEHALSLCRQHKIRIAILKENSPSCGSSLVHDGSFSGRLIAGEGITTALLRRSGISVFSENQFDQAARALDSLDAS